MCGYSKEDWVKLATMAEVRLGSVIDEYSSFNVYDLKKSDFLPCYVLMYR